MPNLVTYLNQTPTIFESCVLKCDSMNEYHKNMCIKVIALRAQHLTLLGSIANVFVGTYMTIHLDMGILTC